MRNFQDIFETSKRSFISVSFNLHDCTYVYQTAVREHFLINLIQLTVICKKTTNFDIVGNKAKVRISKRMFQESKARQNFRKTNIFYPPDTQTDVWV